jgi:hypothetical protein
MKHGVRGLGNEGICAGKSVHGNVRDIYDVFAMPSGPGNAGVGPGFKV